MRVSGGSDTVPMRPESPAAHCLSWLRPHLLVIAESHAVSSGSGASRPGAVSRRTSPVRRATVARVPWPHRPMTPSREQDELDRGGNRPAEGRRRRRSGPSGSPCRAGARVFCRARCRSQAAATRRITHPELSLSHHARIVSRQLAPRTHTLECLVSALTRHFACSRRVRPAEGHGELRVGNALACVFTARSRRGLCRAHVELFGGVDCPLGSCGLDLLLPPVVPRVLSESVCLDTAYVSGLRSATGG